eukprot:TRINITY_DN7253_c0_g2_i1.p1 TRINITY_DN7253_c0_g2~~TRINITY_DN7253_c0_g2_i1.p1  ORF type:complete len:4818 (+),score=1605.91 TRINITY_DN7253_c0_g2_i1:85-14538(+)
MSGEGADPPASAGPPLTSEQLTNHLQLLALPIAIEGAEVAAAVAQDAKPDAENAVEKFLTEQGSAAVLFMYSDSERACKVTVEPRKVESAVRSVVALVKTQPDLRLDGNVHLSKQTSCTVLPSGSPFNIFLRLMQSAFEPLLSAFVEANPKDRREKAEVMQSVEELLVNLSDQSSMKIPHVDLEKYIHEAVKQKCDMYPDKAPAEITDAIAAEKQTGSEKSWDTEFISVMWRMFQQCDKDIKAMVEMEAKKKSSVLTNAREEIKFWSNLLESVLDLQKQLNTKAWHVQFDILKRGNKIFLSGVNGLEHETGMRTCISNVRDYVKLFQDFPISKLHQAKSIDQLQNAVEALFDTMSKHIKPSLKYPIPRAMNLIDAVTRDFNKQLLKILSSGLLGMDYETFETATRGCDALFSDWTTNYRRFNESAKQAARKQSGFKHIPERVQMEHLPLKQRVEQVFVFRRGHQKFVQVLKEVMPSDGSGKEGLDALEEMRKAYNGVKEAMKERLLDVTDAGSILWESAHRAYEESVDKVEQHITEKLRERLNAAETAIEMFRVFSKFNPLTSSRPKIRSAIQQYQANLIQKVKHDMDALKEKFTAKYENSEAKSMSRVGNLPVVSSNIIWAKAIERQLQTYMKRVEDVYGRGWDRLKSMRKKSDGTQGTVSGYWTLDEQLAEFIGVKQTQMEKNARDCLSSAGWLRLADQQQTSEVKDLELRVIGTAIALAFLDVVFPDCKSDWQTLFDEGKESLNKMEKQLTVDGTYNSIRSLLQDIGVATRHMEGSHLRSEGEAFRQKINENIVKLMNTWNAEMKRLIRTEWSIFQFTDKNTSDVGDDSSVAGRSKQRVDVQGNIFDIVSGVTGDYLEVNFNPGIVQLIKEVQAMHWLNYMRNVDFEIAETAVAAKDAYPHAMALWESTKLFQRDVKNVDKARAMLLAKETQNVYKQITQGMRLKWEHELELNKVSKYAKTLHEAVATHHKRLEDLNKRFLEIEKAVETLEKCEPNAESFKTALESVQKVLDDLNLEKFSNMGFWVKDLDEKVERILTTRLTEVLKQWTYRFMKLGDSEETTEGGGTGGGEEKPRNSKKARFHMEPVEIKIKIHNRVMVLEPSIDLARMEWTQRLQEVLGWILNVPKLQASRYDDSLAGVDQTGGVLPDTSYTAVFEMVDSTVVYNAFSKIDKRCTEAFKYFEDWMKFQALWEMELDRIVELCGSELSRWLSLLGDISQSKNMMDTSEVTKSFGAVVVCYQNVQEKVSKKYDETNKKLLEKFMVLLGEKKKGFYENVHEEREVLERMDFTADSKNKIMFLTRLPAIRKKCPVWEKEIELLGKGEHMFKKQHVRDDQFPEGWLSHERLQGEWGAFISALENRKAEVEKDKDELQTYVADMDKECDDKFQQLKKDWNANKPVEGAKPGESINAITIFEGKATELKEQFNLICQAKEALGMDVRDMGKMGALTDDIDTLKGVWDKLYGVYKDLDELGEVLWKSVNSRTVSGSLRGLETKLKNFPSNIRTYTAFIDLSNKIDGLIKINPIIGDLCSDSIKERHWNQIVQLVPNADGFGNMNTLTLGKVWACDLVKYQNGFQHVIRQAQGEMALEEFLAQVRKAWQDMELEVVEYQKKCHLIKGWDTVSEKLSEHINSLQSMRMSPYFKAFEEEGTTWEDKLTKIQNLFGVPEGHWYEVQRRWVYLEGIFIGNQDIKRQLPNETQAFMRVDSEFKGLMQKVKRAPFILEAFAIPGVTEKLGGLLRSLQGIQKALGDYLESQRRNFPRFYFVGDEDLLEIIGHSKEPQAVQKHFKKMFAGICMLDIDDEGEGAPLLNSMKSFEDEVVAFTKPISLMQTPAVNDWLKAVQERMQEALRVEGVEASKQIATFSSQPEKGLSEWLQRFPSQILELAILTEWTRLVEEQLRGLKGSPDLGKVKATCITMLSALAEMVLHVSKDPIRRKKIEHLITSLVYQRDASGRLEDKRCASADDFDWLVHMRMYSRKGNNNVEAAYAEIANATLNYSYEYLGVGERLVQTPLTDKCYLTLTQALHTKMGGAPSGPAGTGKTETVKALGTLLARFVLVFCCDEAFDFKAMGRIFVGLCQVGAWGCFDEFNRLEERILSAVSQQIQIIQVGLSAGKSVIHLLDRDVPMHENVGIFITMNPGYAGRSELPDNLKQLFRSVAMSAPDREIIAEVMLFSQGFQLAELLAKKIVPLFQLCKDQLSPQGHYDFGLRALKSCLVNAGNMKREDKGTAILTEEEENYILLKSVTKTIEPKLVADDIALFHSLCSDVFPGLSLEESGLEKLIQCIKDVCKETNLLCKEGSLWLHKVLQLHQIQSIHHGLMLVGPSCSGKTVAWSSLLLAMSRIDNCEGVAHVIDPKALSKAELYGNLDQTTREWTDGIFTDILRKIVDNQTGEEDKKIHWIIFDGDVDPEWVENLNSLLDDNRLLTLPNGERLTLPKNVRVMFEVQDLKYATLATVSRCGMVWFSEDVCTIPMALHHYIHSVHSKPLEYLITPYEPLRSTKKYEQALESLTAGGDANMFGGGHSEMEMETQKAFVDIIRPYFEDGNVVHLALEVAEELLHDHTIMEWNSHQYLGGLFSLVNKGIQDIIDYNVNHPDFLLQQEIVASYAPKRLLMSLAWAFAGACNFQRRMEFCARLVQLAKERGLGQHLPQGDLLDYEVVLEDAEWSPWDRNVVQVDIPAHKVGTNDVIIATVDTVRHEEVVLSWLQAHRPMMFCGPPGSGKTMTLTSVLRRLTDYEPIFLNFSSGSNPDMILKTFDHPSFTYTSAPGIGPVLRPSTPGKWIVVFCDECNLPATDDYGTQRVISLLRQMMERGGFFKPGPSGELTWITLQRVQFAGACNPPTDPGRVPLSHRFLRWSPLLFVDFPSKPSLEAIYGTFCRAFLKPLNNLKQFGDQLARAMVQFYQASQKHFTPEMQAHYVYSPRELSRWTRAVHEGLETLNFPSKQALTVNDLVRLAIHEGLRLFRDRLIFDDEKEWTDEEVDGAFKSHFPEIDPTKACHRPLLYSTFLSKEYINNDIEELRSHIQGKLKVFAEEEMDVQLVVFDSVLDHILRIDRIIRQPLGHMLLVGVAGAGKTVLSKFVAWHSGMTIFQIKAHRGYTIVDFEEDLRTVLKRAGCKGEKICFIFDESNVMDSGFLEYMNALLASGEVPGLFEGQEYDQLIQQAREGINSQPGARVVDTSDKHQMYKWFVSQVQLNLHVIFTMNPNSPDFHSRCQTSPALFNRCTIDWFGEWSDEALEQVAREYTQTLDLMESQDRNKPVFTTLEQAQSALVSSIVKIHHHTNSVNDKLKRRGAGRGTFITPRHYLDFIAQFKHLYKEKREQVLDQQMHLNTGLTKLDDTTNQVNKLKKELQAKEKHLAEVQKEQHAAMEQLKIDQVKANTEQDKATKMEQVLNVEQEEIKKETEKAETDLSMAKPALEKAQKLVSSIPDRDIKECRSYATPPEMVKKILEMVMLLMGKSIKDWRGLREAMNKEGFLKDIVNFDSTKITKRAQDEVKKYMEDPKINSASANKASKACGPLFDWCDAQLEYARILTNIAPLTAHIAQLNVKNETTLKELQETTDKIVELNKSVTAMEEQFGKLTSEAEQLKIQMNDTSKKCERSEKLLGSLSSERSRWEEEKKNFAKQITTVVGDCLLSGGFLAYNGYFDDHNRRSVILPKWMKSLKERKVLFKKHLSLQEYLSKPAERLEWQANGLPPDELYVENAIILSRFQRYPLMIDPSGMAVSFLMTQYKDKNIAKTSFLEDGFMKSLETSLRFGYPLLVQDVECLDPIMNPILNKEVSKQGGRTLIRLGDQSIDLSPAFKIFLSTRDPTFQFAPDLCGRVTFANFTVTPGSLTSQCLHHTLKVERPDIEEQRSEMLKAQGEYMMKQRMLEQQLLEEISKAQGNILENDELIKQLEILKATTTEVKEKLEKTDETMEHIKKVEKQFRAVADGSSKLYFMLQQLPDLNPLYQFSLGHFMTILNDVLLDREGILPPNEKQGKTSDSRRDMIIRQIFTKTYEKVSRGMLQRDHLALGLRLCQVRLQLRGEKVQHISQPMWDFLVATGQGQGNGSSSIEGLEPKQALLLQELLTMESMQDVKRSVEGNSSPWKALLKSTEPADTIPRAGEKLHPITQAMQDMLVLKVFRPDALKAAAMKLVKEIFDNQTASIETQVPQKSIFATGEPALDQITDDSDPFTPMLLCSAPGFDASDRVQDLAKQKNKKLLEIAMGSPEGYSDADRALFSGLSNGEWLLLKNVHLAPQYLSNLEKKLHAAELEKKSNGSFRIFLTSEISPKLPANLLVRSHVLVFEPSNGMQPSLLRSIGKHKNKVATMGEIKGPRELHRLHFLAAWLHAVVIERLRYAPLGWAKKYEFSEGDFIRTIDTIDQWVARTSDGRDNVAPSALPWKALLVLLGESVYGGRIDNEFDQHLMRSFLKKFFVEECYGRAFPLTAGREGESSLTIADGHQRDEFETWVQDMPSAQTPVWLGLPGESQKMIQQQQGEQMLIDLVKITDIFEEAGGDEDEEDGKNEDKRKDSAIPKKEGTFVPEWARRLRGSVEGWLREMYELDNSSIHQALKVVAKDARPNPIVQALKREVSEAQKLYKLVKKELDSVLKVCEGEEKPTNNVRDVMSLLSKGSIPPKWKRYTVHPSLTVGDWIVDFGLRCKHLMVFAALDPTKYAGHGIDLGMMFFPGALITATRQSVARQLEYPLEKLRMSLDITEEASGAAANENGGSFVITGLGLQSCRLNNGRLELLQGKLQCKLRTHRLWWRKVEAFKLPKNTLQLPLYLNPARTEILAKLDLPVDPSVEEHEWYQLGTAVTAWKST